MDESKQQAAKLLGLAYLCTFVIVVSTNFAIYDPLHVSGNATETAKRIYANRYLFRFGIVLDLMYAIGFTLMISSLYAVLKDVNKRLAVIATLTHFIYVATWVAITLKFFDALRLMNGSNYLNVFEEENQYALARLFLNARFDRYYGVLLFYSLGSAAFNYLWFKSRYIPKGLAMVGFIACIWCALCTIAYLIYPELGSSLNIWLYDTPMALFDIVLSVWLLTKGLKK